MVEVVANESAATDGQAAALDPTAAAGGDEQSGADHEAREEHGDRGDDDELHVGVALTASAHQRSSFSGQALLAP